MYSGCSPNFLSPSSNILNATFLSYFVKMTKYIPNITGFFSAHEILAFVFDN